MKPLKLIYETLFDNFDYDIIIEQQNTTKPLSIKIKGPYVVSETKNANGRVYSQKLLEEKTIPDFQKNWIDTKRAYGELNHPQSTKIDPKLASDRILSLKQDGKIWIGESIVMASDPRFGIIGTPNGDIVASLLQHGGKIGKSTRGVGEINESSRIDTKYKMITVDTVVDPSGPGCFVDGIMESKEFMIDNHGDIIEVAFDKFTEGLKNIPSHSVKTDIGGEFVYDIFKQFIRDINL